MFMRWGGVLPPTPHLPAHTLLTSSALSYFSLPHLLHPAPFTCKQNAKAIILWSQICKLKSKSVLISSSSLRRGDAVLLVEETSNQRTTVTNSSLLLAGKTCHMIYMEVEMRMPELNSRIQKLCLEKLWRRWRWRERERERSRDHRRLLLAWLYNNPPWLQNNSTIRQLDNKTTHIENKQLMPQRPEEECTLTVARNRWK